MTNRLKINGVSYVLPDDVELIQDEDGEIMVRESDGCYYLEPYEVRRYSV